MTNISAKSSGDSSFFWTRCHRYGTVKHLKRRFFNEDRHRTYHQGTKAPRIFNFEFRVRLTTDSSVAKASAFVETSADRLEDR